jgi:rhamnose transport system permease protein
MSMRLSRELPGLVILASLYLFLAFSAPQFYGAENLRDLAMANAPVLLVATGMTLVIVIAEIDISVGSLFGICAVICGTLAKLGMPMILLPIAALAAGSLMGATNGALVSFVKAPSIVVTLATMVAGREALRWITGGAWVEGLPANFQWFGLGQQVGQAMIITVTLLIFAGLWWASQRVWAFRAVYATGSDAEAARLAGISTQWVKFWVFVLMGALTGIASLLNAVRFSDVPANGGINLELKTIAAVVVGGTPITGGRGSLLGTFVGVLLLGSIEPALTFLGINPYWEKAIQGALILGTVLVDALNARREKRMVLA